MTKKATNPQEYLDALPFECKTQFTELRNAIRAAMPNGFEECISYGMIGYVVPHRLYPSGYHCNPELPLPFVSLANQKNFFGFYHMGLYADASLMAWFKEEYAQWGLQKLDMGKSCVRFKKNGALPLELLTELLRRITVEDWVQLYEKNLKR